MFKKTVGQYSKKNDVALHINEQCTLQVKAGMMKVNNARFIMRLHRANLLRYL